MLQVMGLDMYVGPACNESTVWIDSDRARTIFPGRDDGPLFTRVVGGDGYSPRSPRGRPDRVRCTRSFLDGRDFFGLAINRRRVCALTFTSHSFPVRAALAPSSSLRSSPLSSPPHAPSFPPLNTLCYGADTSILHHYFIS